jgi:predicted DNA repair protein MutK
VKMDDIGLHLAKRNTPATQRLGRGLVHAMPHVLDALSAIGTVAMLWVGGGIVLHGLYTLGVPGPEHIVENIRHTVEGATGSLGGVFGWVTYAALSAIAGLVLGAVIALLLHAVHLMRGGHDHVD